MEKLVSPGGSARGRSRTPPRGAGDDAHELCVVCRRPAEGTRCPSGAHLLCAACGENPLWRGSECPACGLKAAEAQRKELAETVACRICLEIPPGGAKIFQCLSGHLTCEECLGQLRSERCPTCRTPMPTAERIRCLVAEQQAANWDRVRCARCGEETQKSAIAAGKHWCPAVELRLLSETYRGEVEGAEIEVFYAGLRGKERPVLPVPWDSCRALVKRVYADRVAEYAVDDARQRTYLCTLRKEIEGHEQTEHFDEAGRRCALRTREALQTFFEDGQMVRSHTQLDEAGRQGDTVFFDDAGTLLSCLLRRRGLELGQRLHFASGEIAAVEYSDPDPRAGELHHFQGPGSEPARISFRPPSTRRGQVAHFFASRATGRMHHRVTSFERGHEREGDLVFFAENAQHFATWRPDDSRTLRAFVTNAKRVTSRCFLCGVRQCRCLRAMLCLGCYERAKRIATHGRCSNEGVAPADAAPRALPPGEPSAVVVSAATERALVGSWGLLDPLSSAAPFNLRVCLAHAEEALSAPPGALCVDWCPREVQTTQAPILW